jgi:F-type H+-transporting ATPase subunit epsilon
MQLSLTTPKGAVVEVEVDEVIAPGALGEFGVLAGHVPFLSILRPGVLVYRNKDGARVLAVGEGVLEVARSEQGDRVIVLCDQAASAGEVDQEATRKELATLEEELVRWKGDLGGEHQALRVRRDWAAARLDAAARAG